MQRSDEDAVAPEADHTTREAEGTVTDGIPRAQDVAEATRGEDASAYDSGKAAVKDRSKSRSERLSRNESELRTTSAENDSVDLSEGPRENDALQGVRERLVAREREVQQLQQRCSQLEQRGFVDKCITFLPAVFSTAVPRPTLLRQPLLLGCVWHGQLHRHCPPCHAAG